MTVIDQHWKKLTPEKWDRMAVGWLRCVREHDETGECDKWWDRVTNFGLFGPPDLLWDFIKRLILLAQTTDEFGAIAAGPVEYLLGRNGPEYIDAVEREVRSDPKLVQVLKGCNQYRMSDEVWSRVQKLRD